MSPKSSTVGKSVKITLTWQQLLSTTSINKIPIPLKSQPTSNHPWFHFLFNWFIIVSKLKCFQDKNCKVADVLLCWKIMSYLLITFKFTILFILSLHSFVNCDQRKNGRAWFATINQGFVLTLNFNHFDWKSWQK